MGLFLQFFMYSSLYTAGGTVSCKSLKEMFIQTSIYEVLLYSSCLCKSILISCGYIYKLYFKLY